MNQRAIERPGTDDMCGRPPYGNGRYGGPIYISGSAVVQLGDRYEVPEQARPRHLPEDDTQKYDALHKSLLFNRADFRVRNVRKPLLSTCEWIFSHPQYQQWNQSAPSDQHNGFLWIKGKPGCGKSTLMKALIERAQKETKDDEDAQVIVPYFFNARATSTLEMSPLGLYRIAVHNLLDAFEFLRPRFMRMFALKLLALPSMDWTVEKLQEFGVDWAAEELQEFLCECVEADNSFKIAIFIDALDEAAHELEVRQMIAFLNQLADRARTAGGLCHLQICFSSRHYPHINIGRGLSLVVEEEPGHRQDIDTYTAKQLTCADGPDKDKLRAKLRTKSARIFLWVVLVVEILNRLDDSGASVPEMYSRLNTIPAGLNELFRDILGKNHHDFQTSVLLFRWVIFSIRLLQPAELLMAIEHSKSLTDGVPLQVSLPPADRLHRYILSCSHGLVEVVESNRGQLPVVQFIHETVREFLLDKHGLISILDQSPSEFIGSSHKILRAACHHCILANSIPPEYHRFSDPVYSTVYSSELVRNEMQKKAPFLEYAISFLFEHADQAQKHGFSQKRFLRTQADAGDVLCNSYRLWWNILGFRRGAKLRAGVKLLYHMVEHHHVNLAQELLSELDIIGKYGDVLQLALKDDNFEVAWCLLEKGVDIRARANERHESPLFISATKGYSRIVRELLKKGADPNAKGGYFGRSGPLRIATVRGHLEVVQLLLDHGADVNGCGGSSDAALFEASREGFIEIARLLLTRGADPNHVGRSGTALKGAASNGHLDIVQLLLNNNADINLRAGSRVTVLSAASLGGHLQVVEFLLDNGADINQLDEYYGTVLQAARAGGSTEVVELLMKRGANGFARGR